jgi:hypothetical protein
MKYPFNTKNFETHISNCKGTPKSAKLPGGGMKRINAYFHTTSSRSLLAALALPCPGLDASMYSIVRVYLDQTGAGGGGAPSVTKISLKLYGKHYGQLLDARKKHVKTAQCHEWTWRNDHNADKVFSTNCSKVGSISALGSGSSSSPGPCPALVLPRLGKPLKRRLNVM